MVRPILDELKDEEGNLPAPVSSFSKYLEENYFGSPSKRCFSAWVLKVSNFFLYRSTKPLKPRIDPARWTHYATLIEDLAYTNNSVEGWHKSVYSIDIIIDILPIIDISAFGLCSPCV